MTRRRAKALSSRLATGALACLLALAQTQCKKEPAAPTVKVATTNATIPVSSATARAIEGVTFTFQGGGAVISSALSGQTFTLGLTNTSAATPTATFVFTAGRFTANTTFGSCTFVVQTSTMPGISVGQTIGPINPCQINAQTGGVRATGQATVVQILLVLGLTPSAAQQAQVSIDPNTGRVTVNGVDTGQSVTLVTTGTT